MNAAPAALVWFRRDLRDYDHAALYHALKAYTRVYCVFVFDSEILDALPDKADRRVEFIWESVVELNHALRQHGGGLLVRHGRARELIPQLARQLSVAAVFANHDYEPAATTRDEDVAQQLQTAKCEFHTFKDQVIFERDEILTQAGTVFGVFTPYKNAWLKKITAFYLKPYPVERYFKHMASPPHDEGILSLEDIGFKRTNLHILKLPCGMSGAQKLWGEFTERMDQYRAARDFPAVKGVSYLSTHLRFGTISIRQLARYAWERSGVSGNDGAATWLTELIWRDFYQQILYHHPNVITQAYKPAFDAVRWVDDEHLFKAWCEARTGYPLVDAAMRQLNQTGFMHNRLRMVTASFLTKDLGIHWLRGERYFAARLNDYDLAANNGGWQWAASTGCDAQPWFRIFNPITQSEKFDPRGKFIRRYVPELARVPDKFLHAPWQLPAADQTKLDVIIGQDYPAPIVDHAVAREATLARFKGL